MAADAAIDHFDAFLDALALDRPAPAHAVDPGLSSAAERLHLTASRHRPDTVFAAHLRRSLMSTPNDAHNSNGPAANSPPRMLQQHLHLTRERRSFVTERLATAAVALILIVGLGATGRLSLPDWFGADEPSHLAAPSVPTQDASPASGWFGYAGGMNGQATVSGASETDDPFPIGSTVVVTADLLNLRSEPDIRYENVIAVLHPGAELVVQDSLFEAGGSDWLPVRDVESGAYGFVMVDFIEGRSETNIPPAAAANPEPGSVAILFIVDMSGSMSYDPLGQASKIEWQLETVRRALDGLPVGGQVGVLAFNDQFVVSVPMTRIEGDADRDAVRQEIDEIMAGGGSELEPALRAGLDLLNQTNAETKHAVLLTDGKSRDLPSALQRVVQAARVDGNELSVIAVGEDAETALLQFLAKTGGGQYHHMASPADIPAVAIDGPRMELSPPATPVASPIASTATN